jgi:hypothetical protein
MRSPSVTHASSLAGTTNIATTTGAHRVQPSAAQIQAAHAQVSAALGSRGTDMSPSSAASPTFALDAYQNAPAELPSRASQSALDATVSKASQRARMAFALEAPRGSCKPLAPERFKLELTASQKLHDTLMQLQHLLRHQVPGGDLAVIVERALDDLLARTLKQRFAQVSKPRSPAKDSGGPFEARAISRRYVPRAVVRAVFERDGGQCAFVSSDGLRCSERGMLELHHVHAFARGGAASVENLKWVCRAHNGFFAVQDFGASHMRAMRLAAAGRRSGEEVRP